MILKEEEADHIQKHGIDLSVYPVDREEVGLVHVDVREGHFQEFYDTTSTFVYYVLEGEGTFFLNGEPQLARARDVIVIPPMTRIYYLGDMRMVLVTAPAWKPEHEVHVRYIEREPRA